MTTSEYIKHASYNDLLFNYVLIAVEGVKPETMYTFRRCTLISALICFRNKSKCLMGKVYVQAFDTKFQDQFEYIGALKEFDKILTQIYRL